MKTTDFNLIMGNPNMNFRTGGIKIFSNAVLRRYLAELCVLLFLTHVNVFAQTNVSGIITTNATWTLAGSPYIMTGGVNVSNGITLTIEPGVIIKVNSGLGLQIDGTLIARGISSAKITFTKSSASNWGYILFGDASTDAIYDGSGNYTDGSILEYCIVEYAGGTSVSNNGAVRMNNAHPFVSYCEINNSIASGINAFNLTGALKITNNTISNNISTSSGGGIYINSSTSGSTITISGNLIFQNTTTKEGGGIYNSGNNNATVTISKNIISNNTSRSVQYGGGGVTLWSGNVAISDNIISYNLAECPSGGIGGGGGGIYIYGPTVTISKNILSTNSALYSGTGAFNSTGGGIYVSQYSYGASISNNSIVRNTANKAAAVDIRIGANKDFKYNTITGNLANIAVPSLTIFISSSTNPIVNFNNIYNNATTYDFWNNNPQGSANINAKNNWWGYSSASNVENKIWHWVDDATLGIVDYNPFETSIRTDAPVSPPANVLLNGNKVSWNANTESDIVGYKIYWDTDSVYPYANFLNVGNVANYTIAGLPAGSYVAVTAYDVGYNPVNDDSNTIINENQTNGNESWFTIASLAPPDIPALFSPLNGTVDQPLAMELKWYSSPGATSYHFQVGTDSTFVTNKLYDLTIIDTTKAIGGLSSNSKYFWRVNASNSAGTSEYSAIRSFRTIIVNASIGSVTGPTPLCIGGTATYTANSVVLAGGTGAWSSSNTAIATVNSSGLVAGVGAGSCNIIYTISGGYGGTVFAQQSVTISPNASIVSVTGSSPLCTGGTTTYTANSVVLSGGTGAWNSSNTGIATVNSSGLVTGVTAGNCNIIYTITGGCGGTVSKQQSITITPNASIVSVTGTNPFCFGGTATYNANSVVLGGGTGAWSSSNTGIATVNSSGLVTAVAEGSCNIIYTITGACGGTVSAQKSVMVNPNASIASVTGTGSICTGGTTTYTANSVVLSGGAGAWSSSNTGIATVNSSGLVTGVAAGSCNIIYTIAGGCGGTVSAQKSVTVNSIPSISGTTPASRCGIGTITLLAMASTGTINWYSASSGGTSLGAGTSFITPVISATTIYYVDASANGCTTSVRTPVTATVVTLPVINIVLKWGDVLICPNVNNLITSYQWMMGTTAIPGANKQYYVTSKQPGVYKVETTDMNGCKNTSNEITISGSKSFSVYPNPAKVSFAISFNDEPVGKTLISIISEAGICVKELKVEKANPDFFNKITVTDLDEGLYFVRVTVNRVYMYYSKIAVIK